MEEHEHKNGRGQILVFGWYGSEHPGDIAILGDLMWQLSPLLGNPRIVLASSDVEHTRALLEATEGWPEAPVLAGSRLRNSVGVIARSNMVLIGGGPLMEDSTAMASWLRKVKLASMLGKPIVVYGCGAGPIRSKEAARDIVGLCKKSSLVILRDEPSAELLAQAGYSGEAYVSADPSIAYLNKRLGAPAKTLPEQTRPARIGVALRPWHGAYGDTEANISGRRHIEARLAAAVSQWCRHIWKQSKAEIIFYCFKRSLHEDDAELAHAISKALAGSGSFAIRDQAADPASIAKEISELDAFLAMRFHSVVFATSRAVPTLAIDYDHRGGKCAAHMARLDQNEYCLSLRDLCAARLIDTWDRLWSQRELVRAKLVDSLPNLVSLANSNAQLTAQLWESLPGFSKPQDVAQVSQGSSPPGGQI